MASKKSDSTRKELGNKLKEARKKVGLTQAEVSEAAEVNTNYYARIERGEENPSFEKLNRIMKVLKMKTLSLT